MKTFKAWLAEFAAVPTVNSNQEAQATKQAVDKIANDPATTQLKTDLATKKGPAIAQTLIQGVTNAMDKLKKTDPKIAQFTNANKVAPQFAKQAGVDVKNRLPNLATQIPTGIQ